MASDLLRQGWNFAQVQSAVFLSDKLTHADVRLYCYIQWRAGQKEHAWPKVAKMATDLHMSEQAVRLALRHLVENDWIRRARKYGRSSDTYIFETQELCRKFDKRSANLLEDEALTGERMKRSPVSRLNDSQLTRVTEPAGVKERQHKHPERNAFDELFSKLTHLPLPSPQTTAERKAAGASWYQPVRRMIALANGESADILRATIERMEEKGWPISGPRSIEKTFTAIFGERQRHQAAPVIRTKDGGYYV